MAVNYKPSLTGRDLHADHSGTHQTDVKYDKGDFFETKIAIFVILHRLVPL